MIRKGQASDWDAIVAVYDSAKPLELQAAGIEGAFVSLRDDPIPREGFKDFEVLVYINDDGQLVGFGGYRGDHIGWLFVHRDWQRRGIGRALLRAMLSRAVEPIWLWLLKGNDAAYALYVREGFRPVDGARLNIEGQSAFALRLVRDRTPDPVGSE